MQFFVVGLLVLVTVLGSNAQLECPTIYTKADWGGAGTSLPVLPTNPAPFAVIHHSAFETCNNFADCVDDMRELQELHRGTFGWIDIAYNFCIGNDGSVFAGRGWGYQGNHTPDFNRRSIGVCFLGTFTSENPSEQALDALRDLLACGLEEGYLTTNYQIIGHQQVVNTECPGTSLFEEISSWPRFNPDPTANA